MMEKESTLTQKAQEARFVLKNIIVCKPTNERLIKNKQKFWTDLLHLLRIVTRTSAFKSSAAKIPWKCVGQYPDSCCWRTGNGNENVDASKVICMSQIKVNRYTFLNTHGARISTKHGRRNSLLLRNKSSKSIAKQPKLTKQSHDPITWLNW